MKRRFGLACITIVSSALSATADEPAGQAPPPSPTKATFLITGLHCPPCTKTLEASLSREKGVRSVQVDWKTKNARIEFDESVLPAQRLSQSIAATPHMMGARLQYGGWLSLKVPDLKDDASAAPAKAALEKLPDVKSVAVYPAQHAVAVQFKPGGKATSEQLLTVLGEAGIAATNY